ncbi:MAG: tetratricopeptide repeat protein [Opitutales bacterium]
MTDHPEAQAHQELIEEATLDFSLGDSAAALEKLEQVLAADTANFDAWHAMTEVHYAEKAYPQALEAAEKAHALRPEDIHINTSLSRIHMQLGNIPTAEKFGAQARMLGWKDELKGGDGEED